MQMGQGGAGKGKGFFDGAFSSPVNISEFAPPVTMKGWTTGEFSHSPPEQHFSRNFFRGYAIREYYREVLTKEKNMRAAGEVTPPPVRVSMHNRKTI